MDVTQRFSNRVDNYVKYRPGYPEALIVDLVRRASLSPNDKIADIGSGTGIFSRLLLQRGFCVFGVEPNAAMRESADQLLADYTNFISVNGTAEQTRLDDVSVDLVVAAQAFHWFDPRRTREEWKRILREPKNVALIWNDRKTDTTPFLAEYDLLLRTLGTDYEKVNHRNIDSTQIAAFFAPNDFSESVFENRQVFDWDGLYGRAMSSSYVPAEGDPGYAEFHDGLRGVFERHATKGFVTFEYDTRLYFGSVAD